MYKLRKYGDPVLRQKCEPVLKIDDKLKKLVKEMFEIMRKENGVGLAASQIGVLKQLAVIDARSSEKNGLYVLINPEIIKSEGEIVSEEGCLSFLPEFKFPIKRKAKVTVKILDMEGKEKKITVRDLLSRIFQHEIDHLSGILFIDHMTLEQKTDYLKQLREKNCGF